MIDSLQVTVLLKECRDIQLRGGSAGYDIVDDGANIASRTSTETEAEKVISEHLVRLHCLHCSTSTLSFTS